MNRRSLLLRLAAISVTGLTPVLLTVLIMLAPSYGGLLFFGSPVIGGFLGALVLGRDETVKKISTYLWVAFWGTVLYGVGIMAWKMEGMICMVMALPLVLPSALGGAAMGKAWLERDVRPIPPGAPMVLLGLLLLDFSARGSEDVVEVTTSLEVAAGPARVWNEVVNLSDVPSDKDWVFRTGLAAPVRCELLGTGVGAARICTVSTGQIPEVITKWKPEEVLAFRALASPPPMKEVNPFGEVDAPHLHGYYRIVDGSFEIRPLENGKTLLTRRTKFGSKIRPFVYWSRICAWGVERGHLVVLKELERKSEESRLASK